MAYNKTNWVNENEPAINADNLNKIEAGIEDNSLQLESYGRIINELNAPEKWVSVGATAPTDGRRVWFKKGENLFDASTIVAGDIKGVDSTIRLSSRQALWLKEGTYTFSTTQGSPLRYAISVQDVGVPPLNSYPSTYILNSSWQTASTYTFTLQSPGYAVVSFSKENNAGITISELSSFSYQLEKGSTATTYTPYIEPSINVDEEEWYSKPKVLWSGKATSVNVDLTGYSFIEVIFCSNDNFYNSLKVPVSGSTFSRNLALCNSLLSDPMASSGHLYLIYGKATLTQSGITIKANVEVDITNTASQIRWQGATNTLLYITTIIGYK